MIKKTTALAGSLLLSLTLSSAAIAQSSTEEETQWDILNPPFSLSSVTIETDETTWSSLDITPDGQRMVFDMLGDIYIVDSNGGDAQPLTQDFAWNIHPSVSPDGKEIAFISDRDGLSNVWVMDIDGDNLRQVTSEKENTLHSPKWSPDGDYIIATKGIMSSRSIPAGEIWLYHKSGGSGLAIKERMNGKKDQKNIADPSFSPDGQYIYYTQDITPGSTFSYNRDPLKSIFAITRFDRETGEEERFISGTGGAVVPTPSPDGKYVAFVRRVTERTALFIKDLETGQEKPLFLGLERDMQEGFGTEGYFAYFDWTPDSQSIVFWTGGKFHKIDVPNSTARDPKLTTLNVKVNATLQYADALRFPVEVAPQTFDVKAIRWSQQSPDGKHILFQALGKLYLHDIKSGEAKRLTKQNQHDEFYPRYSNDGKSIVYTTWNDEELGTIRIVSAQGGNGKVVSTEPGRFVEPSFSSDGKLITYRKFNGGYLLDPAYSVNPGIYVLDLKKQSAVRVEKGGSEPHFAGDNSRVYFTESVGGTPYPETQFSSVNLNGEDKRVHLYGADKISEYRLSHDKQWVAFVHQYNAYVAPFVDNGKKVTLSPDMKSLPVTQISARAGEYLNWQPDNQTVSWFHGPYFFKRSIKEAFDFVAGAPEQLPDAEKQGVNLSFSVETDNPERLTALVGGNIVTMRDADNQQEVIEKGVVLIDGNRIVAVGSQQDVEIPGDARRVDVSGHTVIPGLVDTHAHGAQGRNEIIPQKNWSQYSNVAFGVTTIHDPSNDTTEVMAAAELQRAGKIIAPRIYSTGTILYGAEALGYKAIINDYDDAYFHVQRLKDVGAISVKSYNQPRRDQRQQILEASKQLEMMVVPEGGGKFQQNISMLVDGHTGLEHSIPIAKGYNDLTQLWKATQFGYTPTFVVSYGGLMGEEYWYDRTDVWKNERLMRYTPNFLIERRAVRRPTAPDNQYNHVNVAEYAKTLRDNGVRVHIGAHGQREGLAAHWELWIMEQGGFTAWEAIRGGTIDGAIHLGMDADIGSIEVGKLADMAIIKGDVLSDLKRSEYVTYTVLNGRVYEAATMNELDSKVARKPFFFEDNNQLFLPADTEKEIEAKATKYHWKH
ncbi:amidohydrolase family protein [Alteromonas oceanisediminis]|uniref:amidohydrolase family protein n=1 Tax=Alteromonas oceanisediminis TaxID=2836180 RepID=UPI001BDA6040|nr:amidohydrolase family protein [Alteromonas oceanisediminis]MBT0587721.1 PD40 domain-containing protein [Alteromonas oceanisediminis]